MAAAPSPRVSRGPRRTSRLTLAEFFHRVALLFLSLAVLHPSAANAQIQYEDDPIGGWQDDRSISPLLYGTSPDFLPVSPQAGSLGVFGQIPVGNFTGTAEISIPLYEIRYRELSVPISISYHAAGVKADLMPGVVGLGWALQAGGVISRVINGESDLGRLTAPGGENTEIDADDFRKRGTWADSAMLSETVLEPFQVGEKSDPDEYYFNINGKTGRFYVESDGTFLVQSTSGGSFRIVAERGTWTGEFLPLPQTGAQRSTYQTPYFPHVSIPRTIISFTMTDEEGVTYRFGGMADNMEFSRPGFSDIGPTPGFAEAHIQPVGWYLREIESPNGYKVSFAYGRQTLITKARFCDMVLYRLQGQTYHITPEHRYTDAYRSTLINGCYLTRIDFPGGQVVLDNSMATGQLDFPTWDPSTVWSYLHQTRFDAYADVGLANTDKRVEAEGVTPQTPADELRDRFFPYKLDRLRVYDDSHDEVRNIRFQYTYQEDTRLKLERVHMGTDQDARYSFEYNPLPLPPYLSNQTDHYGYYNGKTMFGGFDASIGEEVGHLLENPGYMRAIKSPDFAYGQAEILRKVTYPTKGYTVFEYEPHAYGRHYGIWPFTTRENASGDELSGGARIRSVKNYDHDGTLLDEKRYHYVKDYLTGGTSSSGVLAYLPRYVEQLVDFDLTSIAPAPQSTLHVNEFFRYSSSPIYPLAATRGNHVTYSEVTVEEPGNGFTVYRYKNYDNGYADIPPINQASTPLYLSPGNDINFWKYEEGQSLKLERGQLLSKRHYAEDRSLRKESLYQYNDSVGRLNEGVRYVRYFPNTVNAMDQYRSYRISVGRHFTYFPYLRSETVTEYAGGVPISRTVEHAYTAEHRLPKSVSTHDSQGRESRTTFRYPFEDTGDTISAEMTSRNLLKYPVEHTSSVDGILVERKTYEFMPGLSPDNPGLILLHRVTRQTGDAAPRVESVIHRYDAYGNPESVENSSGEKSVFSWTYHGTYLRRHVRGYTYDELEQREQEGKRTPGRTYSYRPLVGVSSEESEFGLRVHYGYDEMGRLSERYRYDGHDKEVLDRYHYQYKH